MKFTESVEGYRVLYGHDLAQDTPTLGDREFAILVDHTLVIITIYLVCLIHAR